MAARKVLQPVIRVRGAINYAGVVMMELVQVLHRMPDEVRQKVERFISYKGQGLDATLEERHSNVKALVGRGGPPYAGIRRRSPPSTFLCTVLQVQFLFRAS